MDEPESVPTKTVDQKYCQQCTYVMHASAAHCPQCGAAQASVYPTEVGPVRPPETSGMAIASMVLGILWIYWIGSILAVIFGHVAKSNIRNAGGSQSGGGMATAGLVLGYVGIGALVIAILVAVAIGHASHNLAVYQ